MTYDGIRLMNGNWDHNEAVYERLAQRVCAAPGDVVIDCGANIGDVSGVFANSGAIVHAFEPNPHAYEQLSKRFHGNSNVICHPNAVWDRAEPVRLHLHEFSEEDQLKWSVGSSLLSCKSNVSADRFIEVEAIDLAQFVSSLNRRIKLLKMDIEGAEYDTLTHLIEQGLHKQIDLVLVETHEKKIPELRESHDRLLTELEARSISNVDLTWF